VLRRTTLQAKPSFGSRLEGIEGLRALAAGSVLVSHAWLYSSPDGRAVDIGPLTRFLPDLSFGVVLFFTLSGFLLYRPFASAVLRGDPLPSPRKYLRNRALRILPAYWVILLVCALVLQSVLIRSSGKLETGGLFDPALLLWTALLAQDYAPQTLLLGIGPAWSLAVEVVFYLVLPLLALLAWALARKATTRSRRRLAALAPVALILVIGLSGKAAAAYLVPPIYAFEGWDANWHSVIERSFWCQADLFAFGMALSILRVDAEDRLLRLPVWWPQIAAGLAVVGYLITAKMTGAAEALSYSPYNTVIALCCALLVAIVVLPRERQRRGILLRLLESRVLVATGTISYSIFLWHEPLVRWLKAHGLVLSGPGGFVANTLVLAVITVVLSALTYRYVEAPAMRLKFKGRSPRGSDEPSHTEVQVAPTALS
jgi:peptidoglycan/LPS O-acetylase OafA/YrhL